MQLSLAVRTSGSVMLSDSSSGASRRCSHCGSTRVVLNPDGSLGCLNCRTASWSAARNPSAHGPGWADFFTLSRDPTEWSGHEHVWEERPTKTAAKATHPASEGNRRATRHCVCMLCGLQMQWDIVKGGSEVSVNPPGVFLHTCAKCGKSYRDGHPFSEDHWMGLAFCSKQCLSEVLEARRQGELKRLIPSLETMVRSATNEEVRARARERLVSIASSEGEPVSTLARQALARLEA